MEAEAAEDPAAEVSEAGEPHRQPSPPPPPQPPPKRVLLRLVARGSALATRLLKASEQVPRVFYLRSAPEQARYGRLLLDFGARGGDDSRAAGECKTLTSSCAFKRVPALGPREPPDAPMQGQGQLGRQKNVSISPKRLQGRQLRVAGRALGVLQDP